MLKIRHVSPFHIRIIPSIIQSECYQIRHSCNAHAIDFTVKNVGLDLYHTSKVEVNILSMFKSATNLTSTIYLAFNNTWIALEIYNNNEPTIY